ncbi:MAG: hypothetical protein U0Y82_13850 [Thermoleophilia bacterium]
MDLTDAEYRLVADVAAREGWPDLRRPTITGHSVRTLHEQRAVARYDAAVRRTARTRSPGMPPRVAAATMWLLGALGLGACWWVSPTRTAIALVVVGVAALVGLARRGRRRVRRR